MISAPTGGGGSNMALSSFESMRANALSSPLRHAGAVRQKLRHDPPRCIDAGVREGDRIGLGGPFRLGACNQFPVALGEIDIAPLP